MPDTKIAHSPSLVLDLIRYLLSAVVVAGHGFGFFLGYFDGFFPRVFPHPQSVAVVCFFYLSGFLIVGSQLRQRENATASLGKYFFDRSTRVYVTLIPSLLFVVVADLFVRELSLAKWQSISDNTGLTIFSKNLLLVPSIPYGTMRPIWTLMCEWWIYLLFGGLFFLRSNAVPALFLVLLGTYFTIKANSGSEAPYIWVIWVLGGAGAFAHRKIHWHKLNPNLLTVLLLVLLVLAGWLLALSKDAYNLPADTLLALSLFLLIGKTGSSPAILRPLRSLIQLGAGFSFTLFLTHYTVLYYTKECLRLDGWAGLLAGFVLSHLVAFLIAQVTEQKLERIKQLVSSAGHSVRLSLR